MSENQANDVQIEPIESKEAGIDVIVTKKDPKKVEQGKRLAQISREAKERKMRQKIEDELRQNVVDYSSYSKYLFPATATLGVFTFFYLWTRQQPRGDRNIEHNQEPQQLKTPSKKFETF